MATKRSTRLNHTSRRLSHARKSPWSSGSAIAASGERRDQVEDRRAPERPGSERGASGARECALERAEVVGERDGARACDPQRLDAAAVAGAGEGREAGAAGSEGEV